MGMRLSARLAAGAAALALIIAGGAASQAAVGVPVRAASARTGVCTGPARWHGLAARLSRNIRGALAGRSGSYAVTVYDRVTGITCQLNGAEHFDSASVVKVVILAALLRWHQQTGRPLSDEERDLATLMITRSDNDAATALWDELGRDRIRDFLDAAGMTHTQPGPGGFWGLTQITAHDELKLLRLLTRSGRVLDHHSREYELGLMARVIPAQRWGVTAGAPRGVTSHVKNGWLPDFGGWHIDSIGAFTGEGRDYMMAVLSDGDPTMAYGVATIEAVARVVHRDLGTVRCRGGLCP